MAVQARLSPYLPKCHMLEITCHGSYVGSDHFLGVQNLLISIVLGFSCIHCICIDMRVSPPPHTHTNTDTGHTCTSKCTRGWRSSHLRMRGSRFLLFFVCLFHRGAHMLRSLSGFFFVTENYSTCINRPVRGPRMMRKSLL